MDFIVLFCHPPAPPRPRPAPAPVSFQHTNISIFAKTLFFFLYIPMEKRVAL